MVIIEYDKSPNITSEQRLKSLADSVRRAFESLEDSIKENDNSESNNLKFGAVASEDVVPIEKGGTNANNVAEVRQNLNIIFDVGYISGESITAGTYRDIDVVFNKEFESTPILFANLVSSSGSSDIGKCSVVYVPGSATATGCKFRIFNGSTATRAPGVEWKAMDSRLFV